MFLKAKKKKRILKHQFKKTYAYQFIAALFTIANFWNQFKCPSVNDWIKIWGTFTQWNTMQ